MAKVTKSVVSEKAASKKNERPYECSRDISLVDVHEVKKGERVDA